MRNAKEEFIATTKDDCVENAVLWNVFNDKGYKDGKKYFILNSGYSHEEYTEFLDILDFEYDSGYGGQELFGFIGCVNGVWFERYEYDGSECWERKEKPNIDEMIKKAMLNKLGDDDGI
jgi:hypothetical protein